MKKKRPKLQLSKTKALFIFCVIFAIGIFVLAVSILFAPSKSEKVLAPQKPDEVISTIKDTSNATSSESMPNVQNPEDQTVQSPKITKPIQIDTPQVQLNNAKLVLVFDDAGNSLTELQPFLDLPFPVTISVMPQRPYSVESAHRIREVAKEVFLHQPMQALNQNIDPGKGAILPSMDGAAITRQLLKNIAQIAPIKGMNNHEGSLITSDRYRMGVILDVCLDQSIIFLDSLTDAGSIVSYSAMDRDFDILSRDIFIDNSAKTEDMKIMIEKGLAVAEKQGYAVMIGHVFNPELAILLNDMYPELKMQGYKFITASQLYNQLYK